MNRKVFLVGSALAATVAGLAATVRASIVDGPAIPRGSQVVELDSFNAARLASAVFAESNRVRAAHHRRRLASDPRLETAANDQAAFMAMVLRSTHENFLAKSRTPLDRVLRAGLRPQRVAENVAMMSTHRRSYAELAVVLVQAWMDSPGHRANLLSREVTHFACAARVARMVNGDEVVFATQVFVRADTSFAASGLN